MARWTISLRSLSRGGGASILMYDGTGTSAWPNLYPLLPLDDDRFLKYLYQLP